jgi:hypothetical protein
MLSDALETMNFIMLEWQFDRPVGIKDMLVLPEHDFVRKLANLIDFVEWKLHDDKKPYLTVNGRRLANETKGQWVFA